ncbi:hypothetical protein [Microbacterium sp. NPDC058345]|uniref:hypothetical protein n=1 Tax=Microbacterium sp. NPDC058345 TaxID=3346455 RepID=UPI00364C0E48
MYEHPYLAYRVTAFEQEQAAQLAERRRVLSENTDRIRPRTGVIARMMRAIAPRRPQTDAAPITTIAPARVPAERRPAGAECETAAA